MLFAQPRQVDPGLAGVDMAANRSRLIEMAVMAEFLAAAAGLEVTPLARWAAMAVAAVVLAITLSACHR